jgi:hypothetical protein
VQALAANIAVFFGYFMGWKNDVDAHNQELRSGRGLTHSIQKMLWKLDAQHKIKSTIEPYNNLLSCCLSDQKNRIFAQFYFEIDELCRMRSKNEMLNVIKKEYLRKKQNLYYFILSHTLPKYRLNGSVESAPN